MRHDAARPYGTIITEAAAFYNTPWEKNGDYAHFLLKKAKKITLFSARGML